jgi:hypothetical protein
MLTFHDAIFPAPDLLLKPASTALRCSAEPGSAKQIVAKSNAAQL